MTESSAAVAVPMSHDPQVRWRAAGGDAVAWRDWDGEIVVFNERTGSTHLLGDLGSEIFRRLSSTAQGLTANALEAALTHEFGSAALWRPAIDKVLSDFARRGLAQPDMP